MRQKIETFSLDESLGFWLYGSHIQVSASLRQTFGRAQSYKEIETGSLKSP